MQSETRVFELLPDLQVNIGILISVTRIISRISGESYRVHGDANSVKLTVKAVAVLLPILGISWIFGVLAVNTHSLPFLYIFAVFNSLQVRRAGAPPPGRQ